MRASAGNTWHFDPTTGLLSVRIVQPPSDHTGSPSWNLAAGRIAPFSRDGIKIERYPWHTETCIEVACAASTTDSSFCAGNPAEAGPVACAGLGLSGYVQTAYDMCCSTTDASDCVR